ncbi:Uncharacterized damage-inducible protein DinB (forms a four-helix bundle) [Marininema mesophilum]|uniref:Uncharacterized damage-inducible protein DinB (Forms a four-helix bundle) n=1 Tax=Marininema mesophilum TaxID=1048340 RepID=A0A1H3CB25_9BACL|nr:DinB family protein [Marininema mesophilum]SDX51367.1 Uncharacterized damage-inducible protein DinB (forms a four-helix bundle) [Marininema mesophilum]
MNSHDYHWVKQIRGNLLNFCSELEPQDFTRQLDNFASQSIQEILLHIADCYHGWLGSFVLLKTQEPFIPKENRHSFGIEEIKQHFEHGDTFVDEVLKGPLDEPLKRPIPWRAGSELITRTPGQLLMHAVTHEFHHKGQIATIARQMGYGPPNTDVLGIED